MIKVFQIFGILLIVSCSRTNLELAKEFKYAETFGSASEYSDFLHQDVVAFAVADSMNKSELILNHEFNEPFLPWCRIIHAKELNDSTIELQALETNKLHSIFGLDTVGYQFRYTIVNSKISRIEMDTIPNSKFDYHRIDSAYNARLAELFDWMSLMYPEEYKLVEGLDKQSAKIILEMAELKNGR